jgi:hypothetical protein
MKLCEKVFRKINFIRCLERENDKPRRGRLREALHMLKHVAIEERKPDKSG